MYKLKPTFDVIAYDVETKENLFYGNYLVDSYFLEGITNCETQEDYSEFFEQTWKLMNGAEFPVSITKMFVKGFKSRDCSLMMFFTVTNTEDKEYLSWPMSYYPNTHIEFHSENGYDYIMIKLSEDNDEEEVSVEEFGKIAKETNLKLIEFKNYLKESK